MKAIALSGFMGCGKTSVAKILAAKMGCFYFDLDDTLEMEQDRSISDIFESEGEAGFRILELECLSRIFEDYDQFDETAIISLGGGTLTTPQCRDLIRKNASCIYLRCGVDTIVGNFHIVGIDNRPLLSDVAEAFHAGNDGPIREKVASLMDQRTAVYESAADIIIDIDGLSPEQIAEKVLDLYEK